MTERDLPGPSNPESGRELEWNVPASLATKHAVVTALDHLVPEDAPDQDGYYFDTNEGELEILTPDDAARRWALNFLARPRHPAQPRFIGDRSDTFITGRDRVPRRLSHVSAHYKIRVVSDDEITLTKMSWTGTEDSTDPTEASEGEAKWLLAELAGAQEIWPDAYESGGESPDYYADR